MPHRGRLCRKGHDGGVAVAVSTAQFGCAGYADRLRPGASLVVAILCYDVHLVGQVAVVLQAVVGEHHEAVYHAAVVLCFAYGGDGGDAVVA